MNPKQFINPVVWREYKRIIEKKYEKNPPFSNIESEWEKVKRAIHEA